jgi:hypothetical protein
VLRYVYIGDQINEDAQQFAFFNTVPDQFVDFGGQVVFDSVADLHEWAALDQRDSATALLRCLRAIPTTGPTAPKAS